MVDIYKTNPIKNELEKISEPVKGSWINIVEPTEDEIKEIAKKVDIPSFVLYDKKKSNFF